MAMKYLGFLCFVLFIQFSCKQTYKVPENSIEDQKDVIELASSLMNLYSSKKVEAYRMLLFIEYKYLRLLNQDEKEKRTLVLIDFINKQKTIDGIEPLIFTYVDAMASINDKKAKRRIIDKIKTIKIGVNKFQSQPAINIAMPIPIQSSPFAIDLRGDVMRVLFHDILNTVNVNGILLNLDDLLSKDKTKDDLCQLPSQKDQNGNVLESDKMRKQICGSPGGGGKSGFSVGSLSVGGCINPSSSQFDAIQGIQDCMGAFGLTPGSDRGKPDVALGFIGVAGATAVGGILVYEWQKWREGQEAEKQAKQADEKAQADFKASKEGQALEAKEEAQRELAGAITERNKLEAEKQAEGLSKEEIQKDPDVKEANDKVNKAADKLAEASKEYEKAKGESKKDGATSPGPEGNLTPSQRDQLKSCMCSTLGLDQLACDGLFQGVDKDKMRDIIMSTRINPNPDAVDGNPLFSLPTCGLDQNTLKSSSCAGLVHCPDPNYSHPDNNCNCGSTPSRTEEEIMKLFGKMCGIDMRCAGSISSNYSINSIAGACSCKGDSGGESPTPGKTPGPTPPEILNTIVTYSKIGKPLTTNPKDNFLMLFNRALFSEKRYQSLSK